MKLPNVTWKSTWQWLIYVLGASVFTIVLLIVVALVWGDALNPPSFSIVALDTESTRAFCPGESLDIHNRVTVSHPTILFFYISVMTEDLGHNINGTQLNFPGRPHPIPSSFRQSLPWVVPDIPPGIYQRVVSVRDPDGARRSVFSNVRFRVGNCPSTEKLKRKP